jgi:hypothetical protein
MQVRTFGMDRQPFGNAVSNPDADPRIGTAAMIMLDMETRTVFDFFVSNKQIYAFYERLPQDGGAAAFSYAVPVMPHVPDQPNKLSISFDKSAGVATWKVDDKPVLTVNRVGYRTLDRKYLLLDHGGPEQLVSPRQFTCGMGMFTLLDGAVSGGPGLVRLSSQPDFYFNTRQGEPTPQRFLDEKSVDSNRLWGQGVQLKVGPLEIESRSRNGNSSD